MTAPPKTHTGNLATLPAALKPLRELPHWVAWRWFYDAKRGKWTKPPYRADDPRRYARNDDPATWVSHERAARTAIEGGADGIGFQLAGSNIGAIDLDHCRDPESGKIDAWAQEILNRAHDAYHEVTVSGAGLRIIGTVMGAELHRRFVVADADEGAGIELYRRAVRFITVSGLEIGECRELPNIDTLIDGLVAERENGGGGGNGHDVATDFAPPDTNLLIKYGVRQGQRSENFARVVWSLASSGVTIDGILAQLRQHPGGIAKKYGTAKRLRKEVERCYGKWKRAQHRERKSGITPPRWADLTPQGEPRRTYRNTRDAIIALGVTCKYDEFHDRMEIGGHAIQEYAGQLSDAAIDVLRQAVLDTFGFDAGKDNVNDAARELCLENSYDPIVEYLDALTWDGVHRLDTWLTVYLGAADTELHRAIGRLSLVAAVRRARQPGCKADHIVVLEGREGTGKSTAIETLFGTQNFSDQTILTASDKEQQELLRGVWGYEIADLTGMRRAEVEKIKAFASRTHDRARPAYGRHRTDRPRRGTLWGTTNDTEYLKSQTGNRRFLPVATGKVDVPALRHDRDQLWAEAAAAEAQSGSLVLPTHLLDAVQEAQEERRERDPWEDILADVTGTVAHGEERIPTDEILTLKLGIGHKDQTKTHTLRVKQAMNALGWDGPKVFRIAGKLCRGYSRVTDVTDRPDDP
jgi:hypothetical protein